MLYCLLCIWIDTWSWVCNFILLTSCWSQALANLILSSLFCCFAIFTAQVIGLERQSFSFLFFCFFFSFLKMMDYKETRGQVLNRILYCCPCKKLPCPRCGEWRWLCCLAFCNYCRSPISWYCFFFPFWVQELKFILFLPFLYLTYTLILCRSGCLKQLSNSAKQKSSFSS